MSLKSAIIYYGTLPFIYLLSILPFPILYFLSDTLFLVLFYGIGYRRKIVLANMVNAFPEKSKEEIAREEKKFYKYFCDLTLETFKTLTITRKTMLRHCSLDPGSLALFNELAEENKSFIIAMGHKGNWEWAGNAFSISCRHQLYVIYHPLSSPAFNRLLFKMRTRFGTKLIAMKDTFREMVKLKHELNATAFIADQSPHPDSAYWMDFMNQDTPVFMGTEKIAKKLDYPVVYVSVKKTSRGYYSLSAKILEEPPYGKGEGEITTSHTRKLEEDIREEPHTWLWTHRRWKHKRRTPQIINS